MMSHYHGRQSMRSPQQLSIMSDHEIMLSNENLNFNFDEIRRELANLGVTGLTDKQLSCLKHDLDLMISKEKQLLNCLPRPKSSHSDYYSERIQQSTYTHDDGEYNHAHDNSCYTNDNNNRRKKVLYSSNKSLPYLSNSSLSSSQSSCFSVTSEEFSNYNTGDNYNVNNNNNIGEAKMSKRQQNRTHLDKYVVKKTSTGQTNKKFTEMDRPANHHFMHKNEQSVSSNTLSSLTNIVPSSSGRHIIPKPENKQRVPITDNLSQITFRSPKPSNLSSKADGIDAFLSTPIMFKQGEKVERSKIVENKTSTTTHDNYRRKSSFNCTCEQEDQHSATNPLLGVDVLSATKYDVRTSYLLSNDEVNDNNEEEDETPILSSSQLLSDEVRHYHEQQEQQQTTKQEHSLYQQQNNLQSGNKSQGVQHQSVSMKHYQKDPNAEFNVQSVHPPMLHNGFTLSSSQQTCSTTLAPSCWSSCLSYCDLPQSISSIQEKCPSLNVMNNGTSSARCSHTGDSLCMKLSKQRSQSRESRTLQNTVHTAENCDQSSSVTENFIHRQCVGINHDPGHDVLRAPAVTKATATTTGKKSHHLRQNSKDPISKLNIANHRYSQHHTPQDPSHHSHLYHQGLQSKSVQAPQNKTRSKCESLVDNLTTSDVAPKKVSVCASIPHQKSIDGQKVLIADNLLPEAKTTIKQNVRSTKIGLSNSMHPRQQVSSSASSRRSARFLDDPVEQVYSLPQRPKSAQHYQKTGDQRHHYYPDPQSPYSMNSQRSGSSGNRRQHRQDPVARYHSYQRSWLIHSTPGENARRILRWNIKTAMMHRELPLLQRNSAEVARLLGPYASAYLEQERQRRLKNLKLDYVPPTSRRYDTLRQSIRSLMSNPS